MFEKNFMQLPFITCFLITSSFANDDIIVSADRIKSTLEKSPSDIKVFETQEIEKASSITELLSKESDLKLIHSGPMGANASLFLRGSDSSHTLVIIDGIMMNDPSNPNRQFDLGRLSLNNVERIEILKGSQGLLYGSNAIGGVILITTKKASDKLNGSAQVDYGTFSTINSSINLQKKFNETGFSFGIDHLKTRGFSAANASVNPHADDDGEKRTTISTALSRAVGSSGEINLNYRYVNDNADLDKGGGPGNDDPNDFLFTEQHFMKASYKQNWSSAETEFAFTRATHHRTLNVVSDILNPTQSTEMTRGKTNTVSVNHTQYTTNTLTQNLNVDYAKEKDQAKNVNTNLSVFLYNRLELDTNVINLGLRLDSNKNFGEHVTYKAALLHNFESSLIKGSFSTGFRAPSLNQLYDPTYGNNKLNPEESQTAELGFETPLFTQHKYVGTLFYTDLKNRLSYAPITYVNQNRGNARILGVENTFNSKLTDEWEANLSLTWLSARNMSTREKLARRPNLNAKFSVDYKREAHAANLEGDFTGQRPDADNFNKTITMPSYMIFNLSYNYSLTKKFSTYLKVQNIFDKEYEEVLGYGTGGRASTVGIKYLF